MSRSAYQLYTLDNGLRVAHVKTPSSALVYCGFVVHAGSRNDQEHHGIAHCLEHMFFKGTRKRKTYHVLNHLEVVGGELNAFTTKEITTLYATVQRTHFKRAVDILCDVAFRSSFPENELKKERLVIADEIQMYKDTPEENIYDEFQELLFTQHPLAHNILGDTESLNKISRDDLVSFTQQNYHPDNMVFVVVGSLSSERVLHTLNTYSQEYFPKKEPVIHTPQSWDYSAFRNSKESDFGQAYAIMGLPAYSESHPKRFALMLLNNLLGGPGMNSRLNLSIREKYGYAYNIESGYQSYSDAGMFHCYISCEEKYMQKSLFLIEKEIKKLKEQKLGKVQLSQAKNQLSGQLMMANENRNGLLIHIGKGILKYGRAKQIEETIADINRLSAEDLLDAANESFDFDQFSYLKYLPSK
jgi:predicted Zn-dependent peptidase